MAGLATGGVAQRAECGGGGRRGDMSCGTYGFGAGAGNVCCGAVWFHYYLWDAGGPGLYRECLGLCADLFFLLECVSLAVKHGCGE